MLRTSLKRIIKAIFPEFLIRTLTGFFYGWHGNYTSWDEAKKRSEGYDSDKILKNVSFTASKVRDGLIVYERDSVGYNEIQYSFPVLSGILSVAARNEGHVNVLDFGGALGSSYFQNKIFLDTVKEVNWCIVEQPAFIEEGKRLFSDERLHFFCTNDECFAAYKIDIVLLSSVLQYLEEPYKLLEYFILKGVDYIIIDRTPFILKNDRITIQKVHPAIYDATYPCWFFNKNKFISYMCISYELIVEFDALDKANIQSEFKGFIFKRKA